MESRSPGSGRVLRLDPHALPVRYTAHDRGSDDGTRQVELDRHRLTVRRVVRGIRMKVAVPVAEFRGISIRLLPPEHDQPASSAVLLEHRDPGLSVPLFVEPSADDLTAQWKAWAAVLGLPLLVVDSDGGLREPFRRMGAVAIGTPSPRRRRRNAVKWRRPRFLMRRKSGRGSETFQVYRDEREIIARS